MENSNSNIKSKVFQPNNDSKKRNETFTYDSSAYITMNQLKTEYPALSFDIIKGPQKSPHTGNQLKFPLRIFFVAGSQAPNTEQNRISLFKVSNLRKTKFDGGEISTDSEESDDNGDTHLQTEPQITESWFSHPGDVNRIKAMPSHQNIVSSWSADSNVYFWSTQSLMQRLLQGRNGERKKVDPIAILESHETEGFAIAWDPHDKGRIGTGDCNGAIKISTLKAGGELVTGKEDFGRHSKSVEDLQWSPTNANTMASCSVDQSISIWDARTKESNPVVCARKLHRKDINVISWNPLNDKLLASGSDDNAIKVWDLRNFKHEFPVAYFNWHKKPITSLEWSFCDESVFLASSEDDTVTIWDLSMEEDTERVIEGASVIQKLPPQLMFVHMGQTEIKEAHYHPSLKSLLVSTSAEGFNIFAPSNI